MTPKIIESPNFVDDTLGPQCEECTHYLKEHDGPNNHCMHVLYTVDEPGVTHPPRKLCPCKKFEPKKLTLETVLSQLKQFEMGEAKELRIIASIRRHFKNGIESDIDLEKLVKMSRREIVESGYSHNV